MKIWNLLLEPLEQRYTKDWAKQYPEVFKECGARCINIYGDKVESNLKGKFFLDPVQTNIWKLTQMTNLLKRFNEVKEDDIIFLPDLWYPSLEVLPYIRHLLGRKVKIYGILHAGTYDQWDLTYQSGMEYFGKGLEESWFACADKIFVATKFHKELILRNRIVDKNKIVVTGLPADINYLKSFKSKDKHGFIFTGRDSYEKGTDHIDRLKRNFAINMVIKKQLKREQYLKELGQSKVIFAPSRQETFGYGVVEGMAMDCIPVVPDALSFKDYVPKKYRYKDEKDIPIYLQKALNSKDKKIYKWVEKYDYKTVIKKMVKVMERG